MRRFFTIGHSTKTLQEFLKILHSYRITHLIDIRTIPRSRKVPWFNHDSLRKVCEEEEIVYQHLPELGGLRTPKKDSINQGWHNSSFRGFADYMQTGAFFAGIKKLNEFLKKGHNVAIMCAEAVPWRCHRSLVADAETIRNIRVWHIMNEKKSYEHKLTDFAKINRTTRPMKIYYPLDN